MNTVRVTEVSLSFGVARPPRTNVDRSMPYFANALGEDVERVIPSVPAQRPQWIDEPQPGTVRFVYSVGFLQDVECSYSERSSVLTFHGIKYKHIDQFNAHVNDVLRVLDTEPSSLPVTKYKAVAKFDVRAPWDQDALADIITNDPDIAQVIALCERTSTLGGRRLFSVVICESGTVLCRAAITHAPTCGVALAMMSKLPDEDTSMRAAEILGKLFELYENNIGRGPAEDDTGHEITGIESLREKLPELFVNNYTRECPILPVMLSPSEAERQRKTKRVILYPSEGTFSRYYTAPEGYFVGLKRNRLSNRNWFPCLVTCYLQDHMLRSGSETHRYYNDVRPAIADAKKRPLPKSIQDPNYRRKRADSFLDALELASGVKLESFRWLPQLVKQEMWDLSDDDIMAAVTGRDTQSGSLVFRYFEEAIGVSVHVVVIRDGNFESLVPRHKGRYVWTPPYPLHVVLFETHRTTYGERSCSYDLLTKGNATLFDGDDHVVSYITEHKTVVSVGPPDIGYDAEVVEQTLDRNGKCAAVTMSDGRLVRTYTRPLAVPVTPEPTCFLDSHVRKMNEAKREMGLPQVDLSKRSNNDVLYFPNDASFDVFRAERATSEGLLQEDGMDGRPSG
jgi:Family of unknown function (DUF5757)